MAKPRDPRLLTVLQRLLGGCHISMAQTIRKVLGASGVGSNAMRQHSLPRAVRRELERATPLNSAGETVSFDTPEGAARGIVTLWAYGLPPMFSGIKDPEERLAKMKGAGLKMIVCPEPAPPPDGAPPSSRMARARR